jgi:hypothetical protein
VSHKKDLTGLTFGSWVVMGFSHATQYTAPSTGKPYKMRYWLCRCVCGKDVPVLGSNLVAGRSHACSECSRGKKGRRGKRGPSSRNWKGIGAMPRTHWTRTLNNAKSRNIQVEVTADHASAIYLRQNKKCALSGLPIDFDIDCKGTYSASLDRIDSSIGYVEGNVQWVHKDVNRMKNIFPEEYFVGMCRLIADNRRQ